MPWLRVGPFGLEEIVQNNGYTGALLIICVTPLLLGFTYNSDGE